MAEYERSLARALVTLMNAQQQECGRVAHILHDEIGQVLSVVGLQLDVMRIDFEGQAPEIIPRTAEIQKLLEKAISLVREISFELNPAVVEKAGLQFALERLIGRYRKKYSGSLRLMVDLSERLPPEIASALYKIADQAVSNAVTHSQSLHIEVLVRPSAKETVLEIRDKGIGFSVDLFKDHVSGLGLLLMQYYAAEANLQLSISSTPGKGTIVKVIHRSASDEKAAPTAAVKGSVDRN